MPSRRKCRVNSTIRILFDTTMPTIITTPISDMTFSVVPVSNSVSNTPVKPVGTASRMINGSRNEANCATSIEIDQDHGKEQAQSKALRTKRACPAPCRAA